MKLLHGMVLSGCLAAGTAPTARDHVYDSGYIKYKEELLAARIQQAWKTLPERQVRRTIGNLPDPRPSTQWLQPERAAGVPARNEPSSLGIFGFVWERGSDGSLPEAVNCCPSVARGSCKPMSHLSPFLLKAPHCRCKHLKHC